ncbi:MAG TPA: cytochrome c peroxidase [Candidatus Hydrogenedentes bacterium]|nr:cytochrome c peroxidase [Candidatus Hydrogenedentota bacterium]
MIAIAGLAAAVMAAEGARIPGFVFEDGAYVPEASRSAAGGAPATPWRVPFPPMPGLDANSMTPEKVELGRLLFFDPILSGDNSMACATCHDPKLGLADGRRKGQGFGGAPLGRHSPTLWNAAYNAHQFWDGRATLLEHQAPFPIQAPDEMNQDPDELVDELLAIPEYVARFDRVFGCGQDAITFDNVAKAVAAFERTLLSFSAPFDRFAAGDADALTAQQQQGFELFRSKRLRCIECHPLPTFTDTRFRVIGVPEDDVPDPGRAKVPGEGPFGAFKVSTLRNVAVTAPYMHNGHFDTLDAIIDFYADGAGLANDPPAENIDPIIRPFRITNEEKAAVIAFLHALTDTSLQPSRPERVPSGLVATAPPSVPIE